MSSVDEQLGERVRAARSRLGLTQERVAAELGIPRSAVSDIETGKRAVAAAELVVLSKLFGDPVDRLLGVLPDESAEDVMFRAESVPDASRAAVNRWIGLCETYQQLEVEAGEEKRAALRPVNRTVSTFEEAEALADEERARLELGPTPAHVLLDVLEERLGIKVFHLDLEDGISGASVVSARFGPAILVNRKHRPGRRVFTLAHELFHLVSHRPAILRAEPGTGTSVVSSWHLCEGKGEGKDRVEQLADRFAGRLLLPPDHFLERLRLVVRADRSADHLDLIAVARYFGVSVQAVFVQLAMRRLVPWELAMKAYQDPALHEGIVQAGPETGAAPQRFRRLAIRGYLAERISRGKLAELLEIGVLDVDDMLKRNGAGGEDRGISVAVPR